MADIATLVRTHWTRITRFNRNTKFVGRRLSFESLEGRQMLAVITVTNLNDAPVAGAGDAPGTLRQAIFDANNSVGPDTISFSAGLSGTVELSVVGNTGLGASALLVTSEITIEGNANGITIGRAGGAPEMRLFRVAPTGDLTLESIMLTSGVARGAAGAMPGDSGSVGQGGAVYNEGTLEIAVSTVYGNQAVGGDGNGSGAGGSGLGGAIYNAGGDVTLVNATFSANSAEGGAGGATGSAFGGAIYGINGGVSIYNSTITESTATTGRGVYVLGANGTATVEIFSSIIAQGDAPVADVLVSIDTGGEVSVAGGNNLVRREIGFPPSWNVDPMLGPLADNGGPTLTHALLAGSPALSEGANPLSLGSDGRGSGFARVSGGQADIGAFEVQTTGGPALLGDYNENQVVDAADYVLWRKTMNSQVTAYEGADGSGNGTIDTEDYGVWSEAFGNTSASAESAAPANSLENERNGHLVRPFAQFHLSPIRSVGNHEDLAVPKQNAAASSDRLELEIALLETLTWNGSVPASVGIPIAWANTRGVNEVRDQGPDDRLADLVWESWPALPMLAASP